MNQSSAACVRALLLVWVTVGSAASAAPPAGSPPDVGADSAATSAHVYAQVQLLHAELDRIRIEMGRPKAVVRKIDVANVAPREVLFQMQTLVKKANRLSFEHTREIGEEPTAPSGSITSADVLALSFVALERITRVKTQIGIPEVGVPPPLDPSKTPTDVLIATVDANRQLNLLLAQPFSPADVYEKLTLAIGYVARLRARFPGDRLPETPPYIRGKQPAEVGRKLIECLHLIEGIAARSGIEMLLLEPNAENVARFTSSDIYDVATLLVSELAFLWRQLEDVEPPRPAYYPGVRFPSHVYQRAELLERQLLELAKHAKASPDWLRSR